MKIGIGKLRHLVTLQRQTGATDSTGAETQTWSNLATVWAAIQPFTGRELFQNNQLTALGDTRILLRYYPGLRPKDRVLFGTRIFEIRDVSNRDERNIEMELIAQERA